MALFDYLENTEHTNFLTGHTGLHVMILWCLDTVEINLHLNSIPQQCFKVLTEQNTLPTSSS